MLVTNDTRVFWPIQYLFPRTKENKQQQNNVSSCRNSGKFPPPTYAKSSPQSSKWASFGTAAVVWGNEHSRVSTASQLVLASDALRHLETEILLDLDLCQINLWPRSPLASKWLQYYIGHDCNSIQRGFEFIWGHGLYSSSVTKAWQQQ